MASPDRNEDARASDPSFTASEEPGNRKSFDADASGQVPTPMPLLASEALKDDLAPVAPARVAARVWAAIIGAAFVLQGLGPHLLDLAEGDPIPGYALGGSAIVLAVLPMGYAVRAALMAALSVVCLGMALAGLGPASVLGASVGAWGLLHVVAATSLPAALLFRARYRAYTGTRVILATCMAAGLPFVIYASTMVVRGELAVQIGAGIALAMFVISLLGFMGSETTVAAEYLAGAVILAVAGELGTEAVTAALIEQGLPAIGVVLGSVAAFAAATMLGALGWFQVLAARHWGQARSVDFRRAPPDRGSARSLEDTWSGRG